jgi:tetratricopeptide (TPR) repeat protein
MSKKNNLTIKENFLIALENYKKKNFLIAENICNKILSIDSHNFDSLVLLSNISAINNNYNKAKELLTKANQIKPNNLSVLNNLGTAFKELGDIKKSISFYEKVIKIHPEHTNALYNLGIIFLNAKEFKKAKIFFTKTVKVQPNYAAAFVMLANVNVELKERENAVSNYQKAIEINPKLVSAHNNLGLVYRMLNDYDNAINCYRKAIEIKPKHGGAHHNLAIALKELGNFEESIKSHEEAIKCEPDNLINYFYLNDLKNDVLNDELKNKIIKIINDKNQPKRNIAYGNYLLSKYEKNDSNYEKELNYLIDGHRFFFNSKKEKFDLAIKYCFEDVMQISQGAKVENLSNKMKSEVKPIFIIGVPRCGSTLVEKIIGSGKKFVPMGEETTVFENYINSKILQKQSLNLGDVADVSNEISNVYKNKGLVLDKFENRFTDKSLNNFFYLELINDIYPNAKIINCRRDILSSIMSIFQNNITELSWAHDLDNIFKYFNNYFEIIENYKKENSNFLYDLEFKKLVNNPEIETKKLMEFCDLPWDKKCLKFYKRKDLISKTASNVQVRKAIYKHPSNKYAPYKKLLEKYGKKYTWYN